MTISMRPARLSATRGIDRNICPYDEQEAAGLPIFIDGASNGAQKVGGELHLVDNRPVAFIEQDHSPDHIHEELRGLDVPIGCYEDAHKLARADDIRRRFVDRGATTGQIVMFGLTGTGSQPATNTVLILCLQLKEFTVGVGLVLCFSVGQILFAIEARISKRAAGLFTNQLTPPRI